MSNFNTWWAFCMAPNRDGLAEDSTDDDAGETRWGWTYPTWTEAKVFIQGTATRELFMQMTRDQAGALAQVYHWSHRCNARALSTGFDLIVADWHWTSGGAIRTIQGNVGVIADGYLGPISAAAINAFPDFIEKCTQWRIEYYDALELRKKFPGLYTRADDAATEARRMIARGP